MIKSIPLNKLTCSQNNVRRSSDPEADLQLKTDIEARGLLQNLVVTAIARPRGCFAVEGGGRRLRALQALAEEGKIARTHAVCCFVLDGDPAAAKEASLAENFQRLSMNPADECLAFSQLIEQGSDAEQVARRFGLSTRFVEGRLRLARLAPQIFEALGAGEIGLDVAKAYAATPDQERQAHVFEQMSRGYGAAHPDSIRRMMTQSTASGSDRRARFVGEEAYLAAGGRIERDLFSDEEADRWLDIAVLERLALERLETLAADAAIEAGLAWVRPTLEAWVCYPETEGLQRATVAFAPLSAEEEARLGALDAEMEELASSLEDESLGDEGRATAEARIREISAEMQRIGDRPPVVDESLKATVGAFLLLDREGRPRLDHGRFTMIGEGGGNEPEDEEAPSSAATPPRKAGLSKRLADELAIQRRDVLSAHVASDPGFALSLACFLMADGIGGCRFEKKGSSLSAPAPSDPIAGFKAPAAEATRAAADAADALDRSWRDRETLSERFDAFRQLGEDVRLAWLAHAVARTLEASLNHEGAHSCAFHDHLGLLLGIDVADWWRPTCANFFDRVPKGVALAALEDVGGSAFAAQHKGSRKADLALACEKVFAADFIGEAEVKLKALAWVPEAMRFASPSHEEAGGDPTGAVGGQSSGVLPDTAEPVEAEVMLAA